MSPYTLMFIGERDGKPVSPSASVRITDPSNAEDVAQKIDWALQALAHDGMRYRQIVVIPR